MIIFHDLSKLHFCKFPDRKRMGIAEFPKLA